MELGYHEPDTGRGFVKSMEHASVAEPDLASFCAATYGLPPTSSTLLNHLLHGARRLVTYDTVQEE
jgi:hypothetical protein